MPTRTSSGKISSHNSNHELLDGQPMRKKRKKNDAGKKSYYRRQ